MRIMPTLGCNFNCDYCYEEPTRKMKQWDSSMMNELKTHIIKNFDPDANETVSLHGGEVTSIPIDDLEELLEFTYYLNNERGTSFQTNAYNITDRHIEIFKKYESNIGVSVDGPWPLNSKRGIGSKEERKEQYKQVIENIKKMKKAGLGISVISVISENHMGEENTKKFLQWVDELRKIGITGGRFNLIDDGPGNTFSYEEAIQFYKRVAEYLFEHPRMRFSPIRQMIDNLLGYKVAPCNFGICNMDATPSCKVLHGDGQMGNCLHAARFSGEVPERDEDSDFDVRREKNLKNTPQEEGGCKGCRYFEICHGGCPALAPEDPVGRRTNDCPIYYELYEWLSKKIKGLFPYIKLFDEQKRNAFEKMIDKYSTFRDRKGHTDLVLNPEGEVIRDMDKDKANFNRFNRNEKIKNWEPVGKKSLKGSGYSDHTDQLIDSETKEVVKDFDEIDSKINYPKAKKKEDE